MPVRSSAPDKVPLVIADRRLTGDSVATKKAASRKSAPKKAGARKAGTRNAAKRPPPELAEYRRKRDFSKTAEPEGGAATGGVKALRYVIQKHAASSLHFDLRLELDGVMKSWAVPKGPSLDPSVKRLAMQVEDHPIEYNTFEGIIPAGEYGGGTVMLWDRGTYTYWQGDPDPGERLREGYAKGDFKFVLRGRRLQGSWVLVRIKRGSPDKPQWLLIKHTDESARPDYDIVAKEQTSVATRRRMEAIATGKSRVLGS
jgi:bifunctional non-homologous end joining protein LigD